MASTLSETGHFSFMISVVYLGHGIVHPVAVLVFSNLILGEVLSSQVEEPSEKTWCTSIVTRFLNGSRFNGNGGKLCGSVHGISGIFHSLIQGSQVILQVCVPYST